MKTFETFLSVPGYEGLYEISNLGNVKSLRSGKILKKSKNNVGYEIISLNKNKTRKSHLIHRLVALAFIPNPLGLPEINHKDEDKTNNNVENLEWCTRSYNLNYGGYSERMSKTLLQNNPHRKRVACYNKDTGELIKTYDSITEAALDIDVSYNALDACLRGITKTCRKMTWKFVKRITLEDLEPKKIIDLTPSSDTIKFEKWSEVLGAICEKDDEVLLDDESVLVVNL